MKFILSLLLASSFVFAIEPFQNLSAIGGMILFLIPLEILLSLIWLFCSGLSTKGKCSDLLSTIKFIAVIIPLLFGLDYLNEYVKEQKKKPGHNFANIATYGSYDIKSLQKSLDSSIINIFDVRDEIGHYTEDGKLFCGNDIVVDLDRRTVKNAEYIHYYYGICMLKNNKSSYHVQSKDVTYEKKRRTLDDYNRTGRLVCTKKSLYKKYVLKYEKSKLDDEHNKQYFYKNDEKRVYIYHWGKEEYSFAIDKEPKLLIEYGRDSYGRFPYYVVYKDEENKIYKLSESQHERYNKAQNAIKTIINSAYTPWWSDPVPPIKGIMIEDLLEIKKMGSNRTWFRYKIKGVDSNIYDINVTNGQNSLTYLHFVLKSNDMDNEVLHFEVLRKE